MLPRLRASLFRRSRNHSSRSSPSREFDRSDDIARARRPLRPARRRFIARRPDSSLWATPSYSERTRLVHASARSHRANRGNAEGKGDREIASPEATAVSDVRCLVRPCESHAGHRLQHSPAIWLAPRFARAVLSTPFLARASAMQLLHVLAEPTDSPPYLRIDLTAHRVKSRSES